MSSPKNDAKRRRLLLKIRTTESDPELKSSCDDRVSSNKTINWIVLGMPGVGKGTYAKILSKTMDIEHVSAGDLVREEIATQSDLGQRMQKIVNEGQLLPDEMVVDAVIKKITMENTKASKRGFLLDGFPRTIGQADRLSETVRVDVVLNFSHRGGDISREGMREEEVQGVRERV